MDSTAHRIVKQARDLLVDGLGLYAVVPAAATSAEIARALGHGLNADQADALGQIVGALWSLMDTDPAPPECQTCAEPLAQHTTGRPRRYCSSACRQADYRGRSARQAL